MLRGGEWGYRRLQLLARVLRADTVALLRRVGLRPEVKLALARKTPAPAA